MKCFPNRWEKRYPLDGAATKWKDALRRKGLSTSRSHLSIVSQQFYLFYFTGFLLLFLKIDYLKLITSILLIIHDFYIPMKLFIWFSPLYDIEFWNSFFLSWINLQVYWIFTCTLYGLIIFWHGYYLCKLKLDLRK
jgi:hypothetical protein